MMVDLVAASKLESSFLSYEKDVEEILYRLFIKNTKHSETLKRLLTINTKDCIDNTESAAITDRINEMTLAKLRQEGYIRLEPKVRMGEFEDVKAYLLISMDNFTPNATNPYFRDCIVSFDIVCHIDYWDIGNYRIRPLKIAGYIDGLLNKARLSGIGTFQFLGCSQLVLSEDLAGYTLMFSAVHGNDDKLEPEE